MSRRRRRHAAQTPLRRTAPGAPPTVLPDPEAPAGEMSVLAFGPDGCDERPLKSVAELPALLARWPVTWVNIEGLGDAGLVTELGRVFNLHRLALEDVVHVHQRAKAELYDGAYYFIVARMPLVGRTWETEQISLFLGPNFVLSFQEGPRGDPLDPVRARIRAGWSGPRARPDYLVYAILDTIVDHYFPVLEDCGDRLDALEDEVAVQRGPIRGLMARIHEVKRDLLSVRRIVWPLRDALNALLRDPTPLISAETRVYLRDVQDHAVQLVDLVETYRDVASGVAEVYLANLSQRTNEIMRVLTVISTIFMPLTFIAGVYGMNFDVMPELRVWWGYPLVLLVMAAIAGGMLVFFRRRGWLGGPREEE